MITKDTKTLISICIATYNRKELLYNLLISLSHLILNKDIDIEIIITDNDPKCSALPVIQSIRESSPLVIKYYKQSEQNISLTRNVCVANSQGEFICFIDDDETADNNWINNLMSCIREFSADAVFGYVEPVFDPEIDDKFKLREFYFTPVANTGDPANYYYTTNCIIKSGLIKSENPPFDPNYGLTGGEDAHLFEKLANKGAVFISSREAVTYEFIPKNRGSYKYLFNRALRGGQAYLRRTLELKKTLSFKVIITVKIFLTLLYSLVLISFYPFSAKKSVWGILKLGDAVGKSRAMLFKFKNIY